MAFGRKTQLTAQTRKRIGGRDFEGFTCKKSAMASVSEGLLCSISAMAFKIGIAAFLYHVQVLLRHNHIRYCDSAKLMADSHRGIFVNGRDGVF